MNTQHTHPITTLPDQYQEVRHLNVNERGLLIWLNILSLLPLAISGLVIFGLLLLYHAELGAPLVVRALPHEMPSSIGIVLVVLVLPVHELVHGWAIKRCGHSPRYGAKWFVLFATSDNALFRRDEFLRVALAPLVVITLGGLVMMVLLPLNLAQWAALAVTINAAGAIGDMWMAAVVLRYDATVLVRDEADAMRIFARAAPRT